MNEVRVRFAPSPTGYLHIGGVRTALFNWFFAKHNKGKFILRIEDTDQERSTEKSIDAIIEGMTWLGLVWDEGPYRQTDRIEIYRRYVEQLLSEKKAYHCYCTPEELEERRKRALAAGQIPKYDRRCLGLATPPKDRRPAVRFKSPQEGTTVVDDLVKGKVAFENSNLDDLIIMRSDGSPTYNFCVVIDDATMGITHVIRGDDHLNNTPKQIHLYHALGYSLPEFGHLSMILGPDKARLSKRHGATSIMAYKEMGYLPEAMVNYLARLGWSYKDQEIFSREEIIEKFTLESVGSSAAIFNPDKLLWINSQYIHNADPKRLSQLLKPFLVMEGLIKEDEKTDEERLGRIINALKQRSRTLVEMASSAAYFFKEDIEIDKKDADNVLNEGSLQLLERLSIRLEGLSDFNQTAIEEAFKGFVEKEGLKLSQIAQPARLAITGKTVSPGIYEVMEILGKERTLKRLKKVVGKG
ncbi:MAG: glutamate--tRNA ligase [Nitrospirae bacterium]|nr:glutamate--tRNA ligase [Nitrospirota bacterium]